MTDEPMLSGRVPGTLIQVKQVHRGPETSARVPGNHDR